MATTLPTAAACVGTNKRLAELALADIRVKIERRELGLAPKDKDLKAFIDEYLVFAKSNKAERTWQRDIQTLKHFMELVHANRLSAITAPLDQQGLIFLERQDDHGAIQDGYDLPGFRDGLRDLFALQLDLDIG